VNLKTPNITKNQPTYRYGFQGQERDDEMKGLGNSWNYKYRINDPRLAKFLSIDPLTKKYPHYSPYSFSGNKVIHAREIEGLEDSVCIHWTDRETGNPMQKTLAYSDVYPGKHHGHYLFGTRHEYLDDDGNFKRGVSWYQNDFASSMKYISYFERWLQGSTHNELEGNGDDGSLEGEKGFKTYTGALDKSGRALGAVAPATGPLAPFVKTVGLGLSGSALLMNTAADAQTKGIEQTVQNFAVRSVSLAAGVALDKAVPTGSTGMPVMDHVVKELMNNVQTEASGELIQE
jgi:RHS repeat-associated protein